MPLLVLFCQISETPPIINKHSKRFHAHNIISILKNPTLGNT